MALTDRVEAQRQGISGNGQVGNGIDAPCGRTLGYAGAQCADRSCVSLGLELDGSVRVVTDPAGQAETPGLGGNEPAEADALDATHDAQADPLRFTMHLKSSNPLFHVEQYASALAFL